MAVSSEAVAANEMPFGSTGRAPRPTPRPPGHSAGQSNSAECESAESANANEAWSVVLTAAICAWLLCRGQKNVRPSESECMRLLLPVRLVLAPPPPLPR
jgi:hypothetical protein